MMRVVNTLGGQVVDTWAFSADDAGEYLSMEHSRSATYRIWFRAGDVLVTNRFRPALKIIEDTSPGLHDTLHAACSRGSNERFGAPSPVPNCEDNLKAVMRDLNRELAHVPCPWNLFEHALVSSEGQLSDEPSAARRGDYVAIQAQMDLVVVCSACPSMVGDISGGDAKPRGAAIMTDV